MNIVTEMVEFVANEQNVPGYLARPDDMDPHPGIVVIQEYWGLVPHIKDVSERFGREGYYALAPDLYHGEAATEPDEARKMAMALDRVRAVNEIMAARAYLQTMTNMKPKKVGVVGWCMGGGLALSTAATDRELGAIVAFYGRPLSPEDVKTITAPVLGLYAAEDHGISIEVVKEFEQQLEKQNVPHEIIIYPGTHHAFFNDTRPEIYNAAAAADAWKKTLQWFAENLK